MPRDAGVLKNVLMLWGLYSMKCGLQEPFKREWVGQKWPAPNSFCPSGFSPTPTPYHSLLTWNHSAEVGLEAGSSAAYRPPPKQQTRPGKWWPAHQWRRSPQSPCFQGLPARVHSHPLGRRKLERTQSQAGLAKTWQAGGRAEGQLGLTCWTWPVGVERVARLPQVPCKPKGILLPCPNLPSLLW